MKYVIRKYVDAENVQQAIERESSTPVHEVYMKDEGELDKGKSSFTNAVGFMFYPPSEEDSSSGRRKR